MKKALATVPDYRSEAYTNTTDTIRRMMQLASGTRGEMSLKLRMTVEGIIRHVKQRDKLSQMAAIYDWFNDRFRYVNDPVEVELVKDPERILEEIETHGVAVGDCDDASTFLYAAVRSVGIVSEFVRSRFSANGPLSHVYAAGKDQYGQWVVLDPVAGMRTTEMLGKTRGVAMGLGELGLEPLATLGGLGAVGVTTGVGALVGSQMGTGNVYVGAGIGAMVGVLLFGILGFSRLNGAE